jgi:hypothetical protein
MNTKKVGVGVTLKPSAFVAPPKPKPQRQQPTRNYGAEKKQRRQLKAKPAAKTCTTTEAKRT